MREIKFRAWDKKDKVMLPIRDYFSNKRLGNEHKPGAVAFDLIEGLHNEDVVIMQFAGLHDCKGVEIYEGDILNLPEGRVSKVVFEDGCFYTPVGTSRYRLGGWSSSFVEVIGNIYENPELLTKNQSK